MDSAEQKGEKMIIQDLATRQEKEDYLMSIFKILSTEVPQEGLQFTETEDSISLGRYKKAVLRDSLPYEAA